jgi:hypothetical protein
MSDDLPFGEKIKTLHFMDRTGEGPRTRDVRLEDGSKAKEVRDGDPDQLGYVTHTESGTDRVDCVVQPTPVKLSAQTKEM